MDAVAARRRTPLQHQYPATTSSPLPTAAPAASGLNPNAPLFVPRAYRAVEDFSDQWWRLVESSAWFRDYWFRRQQEQQQQQLLQLGSSNNKEALEPSSAVVVGLGEVDSDDVVLPDADALFHGYQPAEEEKRYSRNTTTTTLSWVSGSGGFSSSTGMAAADDWRYVDRAARAMNLNASPWVMQHQM